MESNTALTYHHLLEYYRTCARTISVRMKTAATSWNASLQCGKKAHQSGYTYTNTYHSCSLRDPTYITNTHLSNLGTGMDSDLPGSFDLTLSALLGKSSSVWPRCTASACQDYVEVLMKISGELPQIVADAIAEVSQAGALSVVTAFW